MMELLNELILTYYIAFSGEEFAIMADFLDKKTKNDIIVMSTLSAAFLVLTFVNLPNDHPQKKAIREWFRRLFRGGDDTGKNPPQNLN